MGFLQDLSGNIGALPDFISSSLYPKPQQNYLTPQAQKSIAGNPNHFAIQPEVKSQIVAPTNTPIQNFVESANNTSQNFEKPDPKEVERKIRSGFAQYGGGKVPATIEPYISQMVDATQKYPFFAKNPYLLPQHTILETSAGQNITRPNNVMNWGITYPGNNEAFAKMKPSDVFDRAISGIGQRDTNYSSFRTGQPLTDNELKSYASKFEPANPSYPGNFAAGVKSFENQ